MDNNMTVESILLPTKDMHLDSPAYPIFGGAAEFFKPENIYMMMFGKIPSVVSVQMHTHVDMDLVDEESILNWMPRCIHCRKIDAFTCLDRDTIVLSNNDDCCDGIYSGSPSFIAVDGCCIYHIRSHCVTMFHNFGAKIARGLLVKLIVQLPLKDNAPVASRISLVCRENDSFYTTMPTSINDVDVDIKTHYNDDFAPVYEDIVKFLSGRSSGLVILHGEKGTGKTNLIRHLCKVVPGKYIVITNAMASHLASPDFLSFMMENKNSTFILEDCEQILMDRSQNVFSNAISNILNMSDGLLSDIFNVKFICTFNADIDSIDAALLRKGRCYANYEFGPLAPAKASALFKAKGFDVKVTSPMTLADIYHFFSPDCEPKKKGKKVGF